MGGFDLVVVGGISRDSLFRGPHLPDRHHPSIQATSFQESAGGKGANQAVAAARLGARVALVGRVGRDASGDQALSALAVEGVDCRRVVRDAGAGTGAVLIMVDESGESQSMAHPGANQRLTAADIARASDAALGTPVVLAQLEVPVPAVDAAAGMAAAAGARFFLDCAPPRELPESLLRQVHLLRCDTAEAEAMTGIRVTDRRSAARAAAWLLDRGPYAVAVEAGDGDDLLLWRDGELFLLREPVRSVDETGAGDAFVAALAVAMAEGQPLAEAGRFAHAAAALATTVVGAQAALPRRAAVERLAGIGELVPA